MKKSFLERSQLTYTGLLRWGLMLAMVLFCSGCAVIRQRVETTSTNGVAQVTTSTAYCLGSAGSTVKAIRLSNGRTQTIGIEGLTTETSGTNAVAALREINLLIQQLHP